MKWLLRLLTKWRDKQLEPTAVECVEELCNCDGRGICPACRLLLRLWRHE